MYNQLLVLVSLNKQRGLTTVEYAIAGGLVAASVVAGFILLGGEVDAVIKFIAGALQKAGK